MGKWYVELLEFKTNMDTVSRELTAGPYDTFEEAEKGCVDLTQLEVETGARPISERCCFNEATGNLFRYAPETETGHKDSVKRDRFKSSAKALASWVKDNGAAYWMLNPQWITDILGEENGNEG